MGSGINEALLEAESTAFEAIKNIIRAESIRWMDENFSCKWGPFMLRPGMLSHSLHDGAGGY